MMVFAQAGEVVVGEKTIAYDSFSENENSVYYYLGDSLVVSQHDKVWLVYENDFAVLEAHDTDNDGELDVFLKLDKNENIIAVTGKKAPSFERPDSVEFEELLGAEMSAGEAGAQTRRRRFG